MTPEARAARERRQKIFVVVGGLLLLGLLAFQLPRYLGGPDAPTASPATEVPLAGGASAAPSAGTPAALVASSGAGAQAGKLRSLSTFESKDPFVQQVKPETPTEAPPATAVGVTKPDKGTFALTAGGSAPKATVISVNGASQPVDEGDKFPSSDPIFVLVKQEPKAKSVVIGIVGGAYSGGSATAKLKVGRPLVLVNTATGAKYRLVLTSVGSSQSAAPASQPATP